MNNHIWVSMAQQEFPEGPTHALMKRANELAAINNSASVLAPFAAVDVGFAELLDTIREQKNQREMDLVFVTNLYHQAWTSLHITMGAMGEKLNEADALQVRNVYAALKRLELEHLMSNGLSKKCRRWLIGS